MASTPQQVPTPVRLPPDLKEELKEAAAANERSLNAEIVFRLRAASRSVATGGQAAA